VGSAHIQHYLYLMHCTCSLQLSASRGDTSCVYGDSHAVVSSTPLQMSQRQHSLAAVGWQLHKAKFCLHHRNACCMLCRC
jgi:hypothetical protein